MGVVGTQGHMEKYGSLHNYSTVWKSCEEEAFLERPVSSGDMIGPFWWNLPHLSTFRKQAKISSFSKGFSFFGCWSLIYVVLLYNSYRLTWRFLTLAWLILDELSIWQTSSCEDHAMFKLFHFHPLNSPQSPFCSDCKFAIETQGEKLSVVMVCCCCYWTLPPNKHLRWRL